MKFGFRSLSLTVIFCSVISADVSASEVHGGVDLGYWYLRNNVSSFDGFAGDLPSQFSLASLGMKLDAQNLQGEDSSTPIHAHLRGRMYFRVGDGVWTFAPSDRFRDQFDELNLEVQNIADRYTLWAGRQTIFEAGGAVVDGARGVARINDRIDIAVYGGLGQNPRNYIGYIGPAYEKSPFGLDYQSTGAYITYRDDAWKIDSALRMDLFKGKLDRATLFGQGSYQLDSMWTFAGLLEADVGGDKALRSANFTAITRPIEGVTNTFTLWHYRPIVYAQSSASAIPIATGIAPGPLGTEVTGSAYESVRDHIMFRVFGRNYVFGAFQFTFRTFDDQKQLKYTAGYRDPRLFEMPVDFRVQVDFIDNYRGFNTAFDTLLGKDFADGVYRAEVGASMWANERDRFVNFERVASSVEAEKEYAFRLNNYYNHSRALSFQLNYAVYREIEAINLGQKVVLHEIFAGTNWRF